MNKEIVLQMPFVDHVPVDGRAVYCQPCFSKKHNDYKMYLQTNDNLNFVYAEPVEGCYWAKTIVDEKKDLFVPLIHVISNHYSFPDIQQTLIQIQNDVLNLSVVIEKYFVFLDLFNKTEDHSISSIVKTDLEYYFGNIRSLFDLVHILLRDLWKMVNRSVTLPDSFRKMVEKSPEELNEKYNLPIPMISYYRTAKDFFMNCRKIRDSIYHLGLTPEFIVCFNDGFGFQKDSQFFPSEIFSKFDFGTKMMNKANNIVSILALLSFINKKVLENVDFFTESLVRSIKPLEPVSNSHRLFLRGPYSHHLIKCEEYIEKQWISR